MMNRKKAVIKIQNIVAMGEYGEYLRKDPEKNKEADLSKEEENPLSRLVQHIQFLMQYAVERHAETLQYDEDFSKKENECELITRLTLSEFSLYTNSKPLSLDQYKILIAAIADSAKKLPPNIHLVIGTLPILWPNKVLHNVGIYVQSPKDTCSNPILHHFDKRSPANEDLKYINDENNDYELYQCDSEESDYYKTPFSPDELLKDTAISVNDVNHYRGAFKIETALKKKKIIVGIEICLEHFYSLGLSDAKKLISQLKDNNEPTPKFGSHILIAYSIFLRKDRIIGPVIQADPAFYQKQDCHEIDKPLFGKSLFIYSHKPKKLKKLDATSQELWNLRIG